MEHEFKPRQRPQQVFSFANKLFKPLSRSVSKPSKPVFRFASKLFKLVCRSVSKPSKLVCTSVSKPSKPVCGFVVNNLNRFVDL